jgi:flagellar basal body-associated protein FliL
MKDDDIKKIQIVGSVDTTTSDPWRTQGDYRTEQKRAKIIFIAQIISLLVAIISMVVTSYVAIKSIKEKQKVTVECFHTQSESQSAQTPSLSKKGAKRLQSKSKQPQKQ